MEHGREGQGFGGKVRRGGVVRNGSQFNGEGKSQSALQEERTMTAETEVLVKASNRRKKGSTAGGVAGQSVMCYQFEVIFQSGPFRGLHAWKLDASACSGAG